MTEFEARSLCILGRLPALGLAELESLYGSEHIRPINNAALLDVNVNEINFKRLGGTIKLAKVLNILPTTSWPVLEKYLIKTVPDHLKYLPEGKFTLGVSVYGLPVNARMINNSLLGLKKLIKKSGRPVRVIPNKESALNSAQVLHNKLTTKGAWELLFVRDGNRTILAQTMFVQDIEAYARRDQARPKRDAKVGMLPPKLAQTIINLAVGIPKTTALKKQWNKAEGYGVYTILDPFCGTGVILQEALLMGFSVKGMDIDPRMIKYAKTNIQWLVRNNPQLQGRVALEVGDATTYQWSEFGGGFSTIASELYLGPPLKSPPSESELRQIITDVNATSKKFLQNLAAQPASKGRKLCLALPAWRLPNGEFKYLPVIDHLTEMGYNYLDLKHVERDDLIYFRDDQIVARQLIRLQRS